MDQYDLRPPAGQRQPAESQKPVFNIPKIQAFQLPVGQMQQPGQLIGSEPEKKKNWKKWIIILLFSIIAAGLGYYFLKS